MIVQNWLSQITEAVEASDRLFDGRSESLLVVVAGMALIGVVMWIWDKRQSKEDELHAEREKNQHAISQQFAKSLDKISDSTQAIGTAVEVISKQGEQTNDRLNKMDTRLDHIEREVGGQRDGDRGDYRGG